MARTKNVGSGPWCSDCWIHHKGVCVQAPVYEEYFTKRENIILHVVLEGWDHASIAETLSINPQTVKSHLNRIFNKTGLSTRVELIVKYMHKQLSAVHSEAAALRSERDAALAEAERLRAELHKSILRGGALMEALAAVRGNDPSSDTGTAHVVS